MAADKKNSTAKKRTLKKGTRTPDFVKIDKEKKATNLNFPVAAHSIEKRLMIAYLTIAISGFFVYGYLKPSEALLTEGIIHYQLVAFFIGCFGTMKFSSLIFSRFYIRLGKITVDFYYGPLAKRKLRRIHSKRICQIYVERTEALLGYRYNVLAITTSSKEHLIYSTYHNMLAKYIEHTLESYLGITNRPVRGEFQGIKPTGSDEYL